MIGAPPPTTASRAEVPAELDAVLEPLRAALDGCGARGPFASVAWGRPDPDDGQWLDLAALASAEGAASAISRHPQESPFAKLYGLWDFQNASGTATLAAGYLYAAHRRVPALQGNVLIHISQWLQHLRFVEPRLWVLPNDPLADTPGVTVVPDDAALTAVLFDEVQRAFEPIVSAYRARRQLTAPNAWGSVVDGLLQGYLLAGRFGIGMDAAWDLWRSTTASWDVATRRWPRRLPFAEDGIEDEVVVRAACCLVFSVPDDNGVKPPNCPNCPMNIGDAGRIRWMVDWLKELETGAE